MDELLTETLAARALKLQPRTLSRWRFEGKGPSYCKIGGAVRYQMSDLNSFAERGRIVTHG